MGYRVLDTCATALDFLEISWDFDFEGLRVISRVFDFYEFLLGFWV